MSIDEEDEKIILAKEQILCDKITEAEKAVGPKPLETIPLPKALDDYTWVSLAKVVRELHQYITDNHMVQISTIFFCYFFLTKTFHSESFYIG